MDLDPIFKFEQQNDVRPLGSLVDNFTNVHPTWNFPVSRVVPGVIILPQATLAAYKTVPGMFSVHALQAQFPKGAAAGEPLRYEVERLSTSSKFASRLVYVKQKGEVKAMITVNYVHESIASPLHRSSGRPCAPSKATLEAAATTIDPQLDDHNQGPVGGYQTYFSNVPFSAQRLMITDEENVHERIYRVKLKMKSPLSGQMGQLLATICLSDIYLGDAALTMRGIQWGIPNIGDRTKTPTRNDIKINTTLNHTLHFSRTSGWDVHEGVLFEIKLKWARERRAVAEMSIYDVKGELIATAVQETYFILKPEAKEALQRSAAGDSKL